MVIIWQILLGLVTLLATTVAPAPTTHLDSSLVSASTKSVLPIGALIYDSVAGPKTCRGNIMTSVLLPRPATQHINGTCYNMPSPAQCGLFIADKADACEARLYTSPGCPETAKEFYITTAAFSSDYTPHGGKWHSMLIKCGVVVDEAGLAAKQARIQEVFGGLVHENKKG